MQSGSVLRLPKRCNSLELQFWKWKYRRYARRPRVRHSCIRHCEVYVESSFTNVGNNLCIYL